MAPTSAHAVYGGHNASNATYPWAVYVQIGSSQWCSGSLVATQWVLTAAHCVTTWPGQEGNSGCDFFLQIAFHNDTCRLFTTKPRVELPNWTKEPASNYTVWVGSATRASGTSIGVDRIAVAPYFQPILHVAAPARGCPIIPSRCEGAVSVEGSSGDVALLHLKAAVTAPRVRLANSLPGSSTSLRFVGFGDTDPTAAFSAPRVLQETPNNSLHLTGHNGCIAAEALSYVVAGQILCVGGNGASGVGGGDSGGPLLVQAADGSYSEIGVTSYGPATGTTTDAAARQDAFTSVPANLNWIKQVTGSASSGGGASASPVDLVFAIDTTGSMSPYINSVVSSAAAIVSSLKASGSNFRIAIVDFKDSDGCGDYDSVLDLGFSSDQSTISTALQALPGKVSGGCDTPEDMYSGVDRALSLPWRAGVKKAVIVLSDAPGHDPEPHSGLTLASIQTHAAAVDPAQVYAILIGDDASAHVFQSQLATTTGGKTFDATANPDDAGPIVVQAVVSIANSQVASTTELATSQGQVPPGMPVTLTASVNPIPTLGEDGVTFYDNGQPISVCTDLPALATGTANCTVTTLSLGTHTITASFSGDDALLPSTSSPQNITVSAPTAHTVTVWEVDAHGNVAWVRTASDAAIQIATNSGVIEGSATWGGRSYYLHFKFATSPPVGASETGGAGIADYHDAAGAFSGSVGVVASTGGVTTGHATGTWPNADSNTDATLYWTIRP